MNFVNLRTTTEYSITQSINTIGEVVKKAAKNSMGAIGITDLNGMYAAINFYKEAKGKGLKPILGVDLTVEQDDGTTYQLTLLAKNDVGYRRIIEINSKSYTEKRGHDKVFAKEEWLADLSDVIVLSGARQGLIGKKLLEGKFEEAKEIAGQMKDFFGEDFYIELQRDATEFENTYMDGAVAICEQLGIPPVATHPNYFLNSDDYLAHEARYCIGSKQVLFDIKREKPFNKEMHFKTQEEMVELFSDLPEALSNTVAIAKKCNIDLKLGKPQLPNFPIPDLTPEEEQRLIEDFPDVNEREQKKAGDYFEKLSLQGLEQRLIEDFPDENEREQKRPQYVERINFEIKTIKDMKFPGYFLIVADFISWAKDHDIPIGPGRGSGAGSLVAYSMKITDIDPLPYNLLFERFLNPERVSMPDFDIDMCQSRREEIYDYVRRKYGEDAVCKIGTFGTMAARAVIRDVGRTLAYPHDLVDTIAKLVNIKPGSDITLKQFIFGDEEAKQPILSDDKMLELYNNDMDVKKLIDIALKIEGITRQVGTHAAGVVISPTVLTDYTPLYMASEDGVLTSQFNMKDVETSGLVKFDFLGLKNLTVIKEAVDLVNKRKAEKNEKLFDLRKINLDENEVYKDIYADGNTTGIFQFEGKGITTFLQQGKPNCFGDIVAMVSLYRPGPMEITQDWIKAKQLPEEQRDYPDPRLKDALKETYGFMVYQEQVMQCAQIIAGYSLGGADMLRRAMGKKQPEEMAAQRNVFIEGAAKNGMKADKANYLFDLIEKFSGYGFNKSHAAAYSLLSFQTAHLKHHYPAEFFTANLNSNVESLDTDKIALLLNDAYKNHLNVSAPDVNKSFYKFAIEEDDTIRYGLGAIKGSGEKPILAIIKERQLNGPYTDFYDFLERLSKEKGSINKRSLEVLVKAGAFDNLHPNRAQLFTAIPDALDYLSKFKKKQLANVSVLGDALFDDAPVVKKTRKKKEVELIRPVLPDVEPWDELTLLKNEKSAMGHFFTSNPYETYYSKQLDGFQAATKLASIQSYYKEGNAEVFIGGLIEEIKWWKSKKGAFVDISDGTSTISVRMFADFLNDNKEWLKTDAFVSLKVKMQLDENSNSDFTNDNEELALMYSVQQGFDFDQTKKLLTSKIFIGSEDNPDLITKFDLLSNEFAGSVQDDDALAVLCLPNEQGRRKKKHKEVYVKAEPRLYEELLKVFGEQWVKPSFKIDVKNIAFPEPAYKSKNKNNYNNNKNKPKRSAISI